ncbi:M20 metallopeptidase family protein [Brevibacillus daliensis]|uniref:M20 metallopeptidase family protein n=1 Tax=Brevibacillus daliensis TaxID=2892995 RepID=UPI001E3EDABD|nr:amidohydrolase [Brevibacillus daliensis]
MKEALFARLDQLFPELVQARRELHKYPELSHQEVRTPQTIASYLQELGLEVKTEVGGRGVTALLRGGKPGKTIALRADFDALPIQDEKEVEYRSQIQNVMHACGHDIHTVALLGTAKIMSEAKEELHGNVLFIFQFGEEVHPGGAKPMIEDGCLDGVDCIYGAHVASILPYGLIGIGDGAIMAAADTFDIEIEGRGGHGASPHLTIDPVVLGSQLVVGLQTIVSRQINPVLPVVITVGSFVSGQAANIIPHTARITGTVRTFHEEVREFIERQIEVLAKATCEPFGASVTYSFARGYPAVSNHPIETNRLERAAQKLVGPERVVRLSPVMEAEDFSYYLQKVPGTFFFVGGGNQEIGASYAHHHPKFDVDERSMLLIGKLFISVILDELRDQVGGGEMVDSVH